MWSDTKRSWCCSHEALGCSTMTNMDLAAYGYQVTRPMTIAAASLVFVSLLAVIGTYRACSAAGRTSPGNKHYDRQVDYMPMSCDVMVDDLEENEPLVGQENSRAAESSVSKEVLHISNPNCQDSDGEMAAVPLLQDVSCEPATSCKACEGVGCSFCKPLSELGV